MSDGAVVWLGIAESSAQPAEQFGVGAPGRDGLWVRVSNTTRRRIWSMLLDLARGDRVELAMNLTAIRCGERAGSKIDYFARIY